MLYISFGKNRSDTNWKPEYLTWEEFVERLRKPRRTGETMPEYDRMATAEKGKVKDGKAFVGGLFKGGRRKIYYLLKINRGTAWLMPAVPLITDLYAQQHHKTKWREELRM